MTGRRLSPRLAVYGALAGLLLLLAAVSARLEPFALAAPFLAALLLGLWGLREPALEVEREVTGTRAFEGENTTVAVQIRAHTDIPLLEVAAPLPAGAILQAGAHDALLSLGPGEVRRVSYTFRMPHRGGFELGPVLYRAHTGSGTAAWESQAGDWVRCLVYPRPPPLRARLRPRRTRTSAGPYPSRAAGEGIDFLDVRPFVAGDQTRRINWRATARREDLVVNQFAAERNADVVLVVDVLSDAGQAGSSVLDVISRGVAGLARHFLREKNRVGYLELGHYIHWVPPATSRRQWYRILELLADLQVRERHITFELASVPPRVLPAGAFVVGWSSLASPEWNRALAELKHRGHDVTVVAPWGPELVRSCLERTSETDLALRIWTVEIVAAIRELERVGVRCVPWRPEEPFDLVIRRAGRVGRSR